MISREWAEGLDLLRKIEQELPKGAVEGCGVGTGSGYEEGEEETPEHSASDSESGQKGNSAHCEMYAQSSLSTAPLYVFEGTDACSMCVRGAGNLLLRTATATDETGEALAQQKPKVVLIKEPNQRMGFYHCRVVVEFERAGSLVTV